jgi:hypothetical protein
VSELVKRLRKPEFYCEPGTPPDEQIMALVRGMEQLCKSAADEIELLEAKVRLSDNLLDGLTVTVRNLQDELAANREVVS